MHEKIQKISKFINKYQLKDPRTWGMIIFAIMSAVVTWNGALSIQQNFELQKKVSTLEEQNKVQKLQNETQKLRNEYYKTNEYKELSARRLFGKAAPGEQVYVIPKDVALKYVSAQTSKPVEVLKQQNPVQLSIYQQNVQDWVDFFFHRAPKS
ncbi:MAG: septum formation initiator family protein [bacterium]